MMVIWSVGGEVAASRLPSGLASARTGKRSAGVKCMADDVELRTWYLEDVDLLVD